MRIRSGFAPVFPYCFVADAAGFVRFLVDAFGGVELERVLRPDGAVANAQVRVSGTAIMVSEASPAFPPMPASYYLYVDDADATVAHALACGATPVTPVADMPYQDRQGGVRDAWGNLWWVSHWQGADGHDG